MQSHEKIDLSDPPVHWGTRLAWMIAGVLAGGVVLYAVIALVRRALHH